MLVCYVVCYVLTWYATFAVIMHCVRTMLLCYMDQTAGVGWIEDDGKSDGKSLNGWLSEVKILEIMLYLVVGDG
jgi:hypothetical protein